MKILMIDNYDSFTYNIVQYFFELGADVSVKRNDEITIEEIKNMDDIEAIVISPGSMHSKRSWNICRCYKNI